jgi:hypothetical protein
MAARAVKPFVERALRSYEQEPGAASNHSRLGMYVAALRRVGADGVTMARSTASRPNLTFGP